MALDYASVELKTDKGIVLNAARENEYALLFAAEEVLRDVVLDAAIQSCLADVGEAVPVLEIERISRRGQHLAINLHTLGGTDLLILVTEMATLGDLAWLVVGRLAGPPHVYFVLPEGASVTPWDCNKLVSAFEEA